MPTVTEKAVVHEHTARHGGSAVRANVEPSALAEVDALAELLTQGSLYTADALQRVKTADSLFTLEEIGQRAADMTEMLDSMAANSAISEENRQAIDAAFTESGPDKEALKKAGINTEYTTGMTRFIAAMLQGRPPIDVETVGPYACEHLAPDGTLQIDESNIPNDERIGIELSVLFRQLADVSESRFRIVVLMDELNNYREGNLANKRFTEQEQDEYVTVMADHLKRKGIIREGDRMGGEVLLLRETEQVAKVPQLVEALSESDKGRIVKEKDEEGRETVTFVPNEDFVDSLGLKSKNRRREFKNKGIVLQQGGEPLCQALDASAFLGEENKDIMHLVMLDHDMTAQQDKVFAILSALDIVRPNTYHNIFTDSDNVTPEAAVYAVSKLLSTELKRLQGTISSRHSSPG